MISEKVYEKLLDQYAYTSSWAVWAEPENGNWKSKSGITDLKCMENLPALLEQLTGEYIFVGLNPAHHDVAKKGEPWSAFHSNDLRRAQDYKLRYALRNTKYWGSFITDIYTGIIETNAKQAISKTTAQMTSDSIKELLEIRSILGGDPIVVAIGNKAYKILSKQLPADITLKKIQHFSSFVNIENYRSQVLDQLK